MKKGSVKIKLGIYQNFKTGKFYRVLGVVRHSETLEEMVLYEAQYDNPLGKLWVRPLEMFEEIVEREGEKMPRFKFVSE